MITIRINRLAVETYVQFRREAITMFQKLVDTLILGACGGFFQLAVAVLRQLKRA
jgi:hypothetical protein